MLTSNFLSFFYQLRRSAYTGGKKSAIGQMYRLLFCLTGFNNKKEQRDGESECMHCVHVYVPDRKGARCLLAEFQHSRPSIAGLVQPA